MCLEVVSEFKARSTELKLRQSFGGCLADPPVVSALAS